MTEPKVKQGDKVGKSPLRSARFINKVVDLVNASPEGKHNNLQSIRRTDMVMVKNLTGADRSGGDVIQIGNYLLTDVDPRKMWFEGNTYSSTSSRRVAILARSVKSNEIGWAHVSGACASTVIVGDTNHAFASPVDASYSLVSASAGDLHLLDSTGTGSQLCGVVFARSCPNTLTWDFDTTTSDSDPGNYDFRLNNAAPSSATFLYINDAPTSGIDVGTMLQDLTSATRIYVENCDGVAMLFRVSGKPTDGTGYWKIPVTHISGTTLFANGERCEFKFIGSANNWAFYDTTTSITLGAWDSATFVPPGTGNLTATLPALTGASAAAIEGDEVIIRLENTNSNLITQSGVIIDPSGAETIYGPFRRDVDQTTKIYLYHDNEFVHLKADPDQGRWEIIGKHLTQVPHIQAHANATQSEASPASAVIKLDTLTLDYRGHGGRVFQIAGASTYHLVVQATGMLRGALHCPLELSAGSSPPYNVGITIERSTNSGVTWIRWPDAGMWGTAAAVGEIVPLHVVGQWRSAPGNWIRAVIEGDSGATWVTTLVSGRRPFLSLWFAPDEYIGYPELT